MKRTLLIISCLLASLAMSAQEYYPEGTKWTEIRQDKLKYDSWYSKIGDEWVPNFETIEYEVRGEYISRSGEKFKCVYTDGPEWTDSLTLLLQEEGDAEYVKHNSVMVSVLVRDPYYGDNPFWPCIAYQFDWSIGESFYIYDIWMSDIDGGEYDLWFCGPINEIKEDFFGGTTPLKYVDVDIYKSVWKKYKKGVRIIQGIGITEWNDGECLFGPPNPYGALSSVFPEDYPKRHYRSKLVHFERNGEVLYNIWPETSDDMAYRPFVEEGKVWKIGDVISGSPVKLVDYYYFDGDTIVDGKTCKQMMRQRYVNPDYAESNNISQAHSLSYVGAWYEENKQVYTYDTKSKQFKMMYDFSIDANDTLQIDNFPYVIGPRKTGGIKGFKGVYREVWECGDGGNTFRCAPWMEGVGIVYGPPTTNVFNVELEDPAWFLMSCTVGDEVIYLNDEYEDGATPEAARKRFDFTHTIKTKPKAPKKRETSDACISSSEREVARPKVKARTRSEEKQSLYGEYNDVKLGINLDPLDDAYQVRITDETGKVVYDKDINAGNIVGLNIDISSYAKGRYTVIVENSQETFTGEFDAQATGIVEVKNKKDEERGHIYNLQGQRLNSLQRGLNIVNGRKVYVKFERNTKK